MLKLSSLDDSLIEGITQIANHKKVIEECESNIVYHSLLPCSHTRRVLKAVELFMRQYEKRKK